MAVPIVKMKVGAMASQEEQHRAFCWPERMMKAESPHSCQVWDSLERAEAKPTLGIMASNPHLLSPPHPSVQLPILSNVAMLSLSLYNGFVHGSKTVGNLFQILMLICLL